MSVQPQGGEGEGGGGGEGGEGEERGESGREAERGGEWGARGGEWRGESPEPSKPTLNRKPCNTSRNSSLGPPGNSHGVCEATRAAVVLYFFGVWAPGSVDFVEFRLQDLGFKVQGFGCRVEVRAIQTD